MEDNFDRLQNLFNANEQGVPAFEDYSVIEFGSLILKPFGEQSPLGLGKLSDKEYEQVPLLRQLKILAGMIEREGELKLTAKGFLPLKYVAELYEQGCMKENIPEERIKKMREEDTPVVRLPRLLLELIGMTKKRNNKLSLTKKGHQLLQNDEQLLPLMLKSYCTRFLWSYFDPLQDDEIAQTGFGFSLLLLKKYGKEKHSKGFYAKKYLRAFPKMEMDYRLFISNYPELGLKILTETYCARTFDRFTEYFGLTETQKEAKSNVEDLILTTAIFDKFILVQPPKYKQN
jgi:hypothetical protein